MINLTRNHKTEKKTLIHIAKVVLGKCPYAHILQRYTQNDTIHTDCAIKFAGPP